MATEVTEVNKVMAVYASYTKVLEEQSRSLMAACESLLKDLKAESPRSRRSTRSSSI